jgi:hypothetical protein
MRLKTTLAATLGLMALTGLAAAQDAALAPTSGSLNIDPADGEQRFDTSIIAGGDIDADRLGGDCESDISDPPGMRLSYGAGGELLRIIATSDTDTALVIRTPGGEWLCNDDAMGGLNPIISVSSPAAGEYNIWVGIVSSFWGNGDAEPIELSVLNINEGAPVARYLPSSGSLALDSGFQPAEFNVSLHTNGAVRPQAWNRRCGHDADQRPALHLIYDGDGSGLAIGAESQIDLTMLVRTPDGDFVCNDELEPSDFVRIDSAAAGQYDIWVGPQTDPDRSALAPVQLTISEF